jgi:two-component system, NarL family, sensor histidine kinase BarA
MVLGGRIVKEKDNTGRSLPFSTYLMIFMILITVPVIGFVSTLDYLLVEQKLVTQTEVLQNQTERGIVLSMDLVDTGLKLFDDTLNRQMQEGFTPFLAEYERAGRDPAAMNLSHVKEQLGGTMDLYVIGESGVIEYTTYPPDQGLDFSTIPDFYDRITEIRLGDDFAADRVVAEPASGRLIKYAYMSTPDHRYLLALGLDCSSLETERYDQKYCILKDNLIRLNPLVTEIAIFDRFGRPVDATAHFEPGNQSAIDPVAVEVFLQRDGLEMASPAPGLSTRYIFVDLSDPSYASDVSRIVRLTYDTAPLDSRLANTLVSHIGLAVLASILTCCVAFPISRRITRPIRRIVEDVDRIADGDLDHRITVSTGTDLARLEQSINAMVTTMKVNIRRLRQSEKTARQYSEQLEDLVQSRTSELRTVNQTANLYLDIMIHDINNANTIAIGYTQFLAESLDGEQRGHAHKMLNRLRMSTEIIGHVATIRKIQTHEAALTPIDLDRLIRVQIANMPSAQIRYDGAPVTVCADTLLSEIFTNLLENAAKFGGPDAEITIRVEEQGDEVCVSVEDTGPGMSGITKTQVFNRLRKGEGAMSGKGLGLYICRMLIERYGGRIWAEDRVPGTPELGAAIRFTLKRVPGSDPPSPDKPPE